MPARLSCVSSSLNPNGSTRCRVLLVAAHSLATFPVLGGISGSTRTTCIGFAIEHLPQYQSVRRRGHTGYASVLLLQHPPDFLGWKLALPHLHQRAYDPAAHL